MIAGFFVFLLKLYYLFDLSLLLEFELFEGLLGAEGLLESCELPGNGLFTNLPGLYTTTSTE